MTKRRSEMTPEQAERIRSRDRVANISPRAHAIKLEKDRQRDAWRPALKWAYRLEAQHGLENAARAIGLVQQERMAYDPDSPNEAVVLMPGVELEDV